MRRPASLPPRDAAGARSVLRGREVRRQPGGLGTEGPGPSSPECAVAVRLKGVEFAVVEDKFSRSVPRGVIGVFIFERSLGPLPDSASLDLSLTLYFTGSLSLPGSLTPAFLLGYLAHRLLGSWVSHPLAPWFPPGIRPTLFVAPPSCPSSLPHSLVPTSPAPSLSHLPPSLSLSVYLKLLLKASRRIRSCAAELCAHDTPLGLCERGEARRSWRCDEESTRFISRCSQSIESRVTGTE